MLIRVGKKEPPRPQSTIFSDDIGLERATKTQDYDFLRIRVGQKRHQDPGVQFVAHKTGPDRATKTREYDLLRIRVVQKEPPRTGSTTCCG